MSKGAMGVGGRKGAIDVDGVVAKLKRVERGYAGKIYMSLGFGVLLLPVGPFFITGFIWFYYLMFADEIAFWPMYPRVALVSIPLLFLLAGYLQGSVIEKGMPDPEGFGGRFMIKRLALAMIVLEIANIGPRLVLHGIRLWRRKWAVGKVNIRRVAEAVAVLLASEQGMNPVKLVREGDPDGTLVGILGYLMLYEIGDVAKTGDRVWLRASAREKMGV